MKKIIISLLVAMSLIFGCAGITNMSGLNPHRYPLKVRQGDIIDKYIFDQTWIPYSDTHKKLFHTDYVDPQAAEVWIKDYIENSNQGGN